MPKVMVRLRRANYDNLRELYTTLISGHCEEQSDVAILWLNVL